MRAFTGTTSLGDSVTVGEHATDPYATNGFAGQLGAYLGGVATNLGQSGNTVSVTSLIAYGLNPTTTGPIYTTLLGANNTHSYGNINRQNAYVNTINAIYAWLTIPRSYVSPSGATVFTKVFGQDSACVQSGTWVADNSILTGLGITSTTNGSALTCTITTEGGPLYFAHLDVYGNGGTASVTVDGVAQSPIAFQGNANASFDDSGCGNADGCAVELERYASIPAGAHTVVITVSSATSASNAVNVEAFMTPAPAGAHGPGFPTLFEGGTLRQQSDQNSAATAYYAALDQTAIAQMQGDGLPAYYADVRDALDTSADYFDQYHPSQSGHNKIFASFAAALGTLDAGQSGTITTVAGNGSAGFFGDGGQATSASLSYPNGVAADGFGNLFIADFGNNRIRKVSAGGVITTVAGNGPSGFSGDGGLATSATLNNPQGVAVDAAGNIYIADTYNHRVRKVSTSGIITTFAGYGTGGFFGDGGQATAATLLVPGGVAVDASGNLFIADTGNNRIRKVSASGIVTTVAGSGAVNSTTCVNQGTCTGGFSGDGGLATSAVLFEPNGVAVDTSGNLFITDTYNNRIRKVSSASGVITTVAGNGPACASDSTCTGSFAGDGGQATAASLNEPYSVAVDASGNVFIADTFNGRVREVTAGGTIATVAGGGSANPGDGGLATSASLSSPAGVFVDASGNLFIADGGNGRIRKVSGAGSTLAPAITTATLPNGTAGQPYGPVTLAATGGSGSYSWSATGLPSGLTMTATGVLSGTPTASGTFTVSITCASGGSSATQTLPLTIAAPAGPLQIPGGGGATQLTLTGGTVAVPYSQVLPASGGSPPYTWSVLGGSLPTGLSLAASGTLSGTPTQASPFTFTGKVTDSAGAVATSIFVITIAPPPLAIATGSTLPQGIVGSDYPVQVITATGGAPPYTFQMTGTLPGGLTFAAGQISGIPTVSGTFRFTVTATDSSQATTSATFQIAVEATQTDLILSTASLAFTLSTGALVVPPGETVSVRSNMPAQLLNYSVSVTPAVTWLDVTSGGNTPGVITVGLDPKALALGAGSLKTSIVVTCKPPVLTNAQPGACAGNSQTINVTLNVVTAPPQLAVAAGLLSFFIQNTSSQTISQTLALQNLGGGTITVNSLAASSNFGSKALALSGVAAGTTIGAGVTSSVTVTVSPTALPSGYYSGAITVNTSAGTLNVPVALFVAGTPEMTLDPAGELFRQEAGSSPGNPGGSFLVGVNGSGTVSWTATLLAGASWLTLATTSGTSTAASPGAVKYSVNPLVAATLAAGSYYGAIQVASGGVVESPLIYVVVLNVAPANTPGVPDPEPGGLLFVANGSGLLAPQVVQVFTSSATPLTYQAASDSSWLLVAPATGTTSTASPGVTSVSVSLSGLAAGVYRGGVSYALAGASVRTVNVTLIVEPGGVVAGARSAALLPATTCTPTQLVPTQTGLVNNFAQPADWPTPLNVLLEDNCGNPVTAGQVTATFTNGDPELALSATDATSGNYSATWTPTNAAGQVTIVATVTGAGFPAATVQLLGEVTPNAAPVLNQNGTLNAFAIAAEPGVPIAPGTIVQIYGSNLAAATIVGSTVPLATTLGQTSVRIGGLPAPLYYVSPGQINAQVPFELAPGHPYAIYVSANGAISNSNAIQVTGDAPGIAQFAAGEIIAQHFTDYTLVTESSPAKPGEIVIFYLAGLGLTNPAVASGTASPSMNLPALVDTPTLTLNGVTVPPANILFVGLTPTLVGLYQVDFTVPANAPNGDLPLVITQASGVSNSTILPVHN